MDKLEKPRWIRCIHRGETKYRYQLTYNTGNDFVYEDDFSDPIAKYKEITGQATKSNPESMGRFHTAWLNMMYPRLRLAHNLLRDDGVMFVSIDDNEVHNLRKLCDEVFGEENFVAQFIWEKRVTRENRKSISVRHDYILCYAKDINTEENQVIGLLPMTQEAESRYKNPDNDPRGVWTSVPAIAQAGHGTKNQFYTLTTPSGRIVDPPSGSCWRYTKERMNEAIDDNRIWFGSDGNGVPRIKKFLTEGRQGLTPETLWLSSEVGSNDSAKRNLVGLFDGLAIFETPKPFELIKQCISVCAVNDNEIVLDFFSGTSTTAHAVMQLNAEDGGNRRFIMVQLPEITDENSEAYKAGYKNICEIGKERIRRAGAKVMSEWQEKQAQLTLGEQTEQSLPDVGFRVLKLDTSNLAAWDATPIKDGNAQTLWDRIDTLEKTIKPNRSHMDIVFEIMLKMGVHLDYVVSEITAGSKKCYSIGEKSLETSEDCLLLICLDKWITPEDITAFCDLAPAKIIAAEEAFEDDTVLSNAHYILRDRDIEMKLI